MTTLQASSVKIERLNLYYGAFQALKDISAQFRERTITAIIGPSGCGKSTLLRCLNRMNDVIEGVRIAGAIRIGGMDVLHPETDLVLLRKRVGMVFQRPNPFPLSIADNITFGLEIHRMAARGELAAITESSLRAVELWDVLKDRLHRSALGLSLEQQQRLCIARLLAVKPEVLLMDEPCSALDPIATMKVEELMYQLKEAYTIVIVTHNMQQAARVSQETGFMLLGELVEFGQTSRIFTAPQDERTQAYITGRYG